MTAPTTLRQARTYATLATTTALTASTALGAGVAATFGPPAGVVTGLVAAAATVSTALGGLRLLVTCPAR